MDVGRYPLFEYPPYDLALAVRMHEVVLSHKLDLLHVHYAIPHATSGWIAREMLRAEGADVTLITTLHGTDITIVGQDPSFQAITKFSIERSDRITAVSDFLRDETVRAFGCTGCQVQVIPNFVDPVEYDRARHPGVLRRESRRQQADPHARVQLPPGEAGAPTSCDIFARVRRQLPSSLVMVGDGPDRDRGRGRGAASSASNATCTSWARSTRWRRCSPAPTCSSCRAPANRSGFRRSRRSPAACRWWRATPADWWRSSATARPGILRPVGDVEGMADAALRLLTDRTRWQRMSDAGAADARARFSLEAIVAIYEQLYREATA